MEIFRPIQRRLEARQAKLEAERAAEQADLAMRQAAEARKRQEAIITMFSTFTITLTPENQQMLLNSLLQLQKEKTQQT